MAMAARDPHEHMRNLIAKFSRQFANHQPGLKVVQGRIVALSGATGTIGCLMLDILLNTQGVTKIYVLHRTERGTPKDHIAKLLQEKGVDSNILNTAKPVVYLKVDFSRGDLGLDESTYADVCFTFSFQRSDPSPNL
jgi:hypothetical protein